MMLMLCVDFMRTGKHEHGVAPFFLLLTVLHADRPS